MKLIVENIDGVTYVYRENEKHFKRRGIKGKDLRSVLATSISIIDNECTNPASKQTLIFDLKSK